MRTTCAPPGPAAHTSARPASCVPVDPADAEDRHGRGGSGAWVWGGWGGRDGMGGGKWRTAHFGAAMGCSRWCRPAGYAMPGTRGGGGMPPWNDDPPNPHERYADTPSQHHSLRHCIVHLNNQPPPTPTPSPAGTLPWPWPRGPCTAITDPPNHPYHPSVPIIHFPSHPLAASPAGRAPWPLLGRRA